MFWSERKYQERREWTAVLQCESCQRQTFHTGTRVVSSVNVYFIPIFRRRTSILRQYCNVCGLERTLTPAEYAVLEERMHARDRLDSTSTQSASIEKGDIEGGPLASFRGRTLRSNRWGAHGYSGPSRNSAELETFAPRVPLDVVAATRGFWEVKIYGTDKTVFVPRDETVEDA